ncbi:F-box domain containing protein [Trema orientale]|uniref:F-box domain containing protein n=1 Tax=Trema orientale TaxID=63057 RepID=A0A2P5G061_TREOI|nr:F-box domain containing protein [Trema orientale]
MSNDIRQDRISNLPDDLVRNIISRLSIREAVRTSLLSAEWRLKWASIPHFVFADVSWPLSSIGRGEEFAFGKFGSVLDYLVSVYPSTISMRKLSLDSTRIPLSFFSFQDLTDLELRRCSWRPPSTFGGFHHLKCLRLTRVEFDEDSYNSLVSSCPKLEKLVLLEVDTYHLEINAPNLKSFEFYGNFATIKFENTLQLEAIDINLQQGMAVHPYGVSNLLHFFSNLPRIGRLTLNCEAVEYLALDILPNEPLEYTSIRHLSFEIRLDSLDSVSASIFLLRCAPFWQQLDVTFLKYYEGDDDLVLFEDAENAFSPFNEMRVLQVKGVAGYKADMDFIGSILSASPVLEGFIAGIENTNEDDQNKTIRKLMEVRRASVGAGFTWI